MAWPTGPVATVTFPGTAGRQLVGDLREVSREQIVILAHGFTSNRRSRGRFPRLEDELARRGISSLAFDFGGCGESDDALLTLDSHVGDLEAAVAFANARGFHHVALLGHSLGSLVCLHANTPDVRTMVLTGALTGPMDYRWSDYYSAEQLEELARTGRLVVRHADGSRRETTVGADLLRVFANVEPSTLLSNVRCPVLLVLGDGDDEERQLLEHARRALPRLPDGSRLQVIAGAPHGFGEAYELVIDLVAGWLVASLRQS